MGHSRVNQLELHQQISKDDHKGVPFS